MAQELYPYQEEAFAKLRANAAAGVIRQLLVLPTGAGKTTIAAHVIRSAVARGRRCGFIAHRRELISQCSARLDDEGIDHGIVMAKHWRRLPEAAVQVASVDTLLHRAAKISIEEQMGGLPDLIFMDEAHGRYDKQIKLAKMLPGVHTIGLTATPVRLDGRGLGDIYQSMIEVCQVQRLVRDGFLMSPRLFVPPSPSLIGVASQAGDFKVDDLAARFDTAGVTGDLIEHWQRHAAGLRTAVFCVHLQHAEHVAQAYSDAGIPAAALHYKMKDHERDQVLKDLRRGVLQVVTNVGILTEGWDLPALGCVQLARPTKSLALFLQMVGRCMRVMEGKAQAIVLDHSGAIARHGPPTQHRIWTLDTTSRREAKTDDETIPIRGKNCPECFAWVPAAEPACPACDYVFTMRKIETRAGELVEVHDDGTPICSCGSSAVETVKNAPSWGLFRVLHRCGDCGRRLRWFSAVPTKVTLDQKREEFARLEAHRATKGMPDQWVLDRYHETFEVKPTPAVQTPEFKERNRKRTPEELKAEKIQTFAKLWEECKAKRHKPGWTANRYRAEFGCWPAGDIKTAEYIAAEKASRPQKGTS